MSKNFLKKNTVGSSAKWKSELRRLNPKRTQKHLKPDEKVRECLLFPEEKTVEETLKHTTRYGAINARIPMRQHFKSRNPLLQRRRFSEPYATDTWFSTVTSYEGYNCAQVFYGVKSHVTSHYGLVTESQGPQALLDFFRGEGVPMSLIRDNANMQSSHAWTEYLRRFWVQDKFTEPYHSSQNPAERAMAKHKEKILRLMIDTGCDPEAWFKAACHLADVINHTADPGLEYQTPIERRDGETPDHRTTTTQVLGPSLLSRTR